MGFDVSSTAANAVLYSLLSVFTVLAIVAGGYCNTVLPQRILSCCLLRNPNHNDDTKSTADHFLSARNSANARTIATSFFASGMGAWVSFLFNFVVFVPPNVCGVAITQYYLSLPSIYTFLCDFMSIKLT
jgi:TctA family transporter